MGPVWVRRAAAIALLASVGCGCNAEVIGEETVSLADGGTTAAPSSYCAEECVTSADCPRGEHCSWHPLDPKGLCFKDFGADGGR